MSASRKGSVDPTQARIIRAVSDRLIVAEIAMDQDDEENARQLLNFASTGIRQLERIYKHRRGAPRRDLATAIRYFSTLQQALCGKLESAKDSPDGAKLLSIAYTNAVLLQLEFPDSPDVKELFDKVKSWHKG